MRSHDFLFFVDSFRLGGVLFRILTLPKNRPVALGFFVNDAERGVHFALCPNATFIRINFPRPRRGWSSVRFTRLLKRLASLTANREVVVIVWGYRDLRTLGVDVCSFFERCWRVERALIEPPAASGNAFVVGYRSIYFDGRTSTDWEAQLNALTPGELSRSVEGKYLLSHILGAGLSKYSGTAPDVRLTERDLLIVGQCTGDQAIEYTDAMARSNVELVDLVVKCLLKNGHSFEKIYYKPHPKNRTTPADIACIQDRYPEIDIIDGNAAIVALLIGKPTVATLTSGVGLEAAVRGCKVHTFGISFYSHWGFTFDHMPCSRRTNRLSAEDVLLFALIHQTRYVNPKTKRPIGALAAFGLTAAEQD